MDMWLLIAGVLTLLIVWYALWGRTWLKAKPWPWAQAFFSWVEPVEIFLWRKSETILFARLKMFVGVLLTVLTQIGTIDLTPLIPFVPDQYEPLLKLAFNMLPLVLTMLGAIDEKLRTETTKPLALVEVPETSPIPAKLAETIITAEIAKVQALAAVDEAKKEGAV